MVAVTNWMCGFFALFGAYTDQTHTQETINNAMLVKKVEKQVTLDLHTCSLHFTEVQSMPIVEQHQLAAQQTSTNEIYHCHYISIRTVAVTTVRLSCAT